MNEFFGYALKHQITLSILAAFRELNQLLPYPLTRERRTKGLSVRPEPDPRACRHLVMLGLRPKPSSHPRARAVEPAVPAELVLFVALFFLLRRSDRLRKGQGQRVAVVRARLPALLHIRLAFEYQ
jgi:hypothetical protein